MTCRIIIRTKSYIYGPLWLGRTGTPPHLFVLLLFFGKDELPDLARSIGASFKELKTGFAEGAGAPKETEKKAENTKRS